MPEKHSLVFPPVPAGCLLKQKGKTNIHMETLQGLCVHLGWHWAGYRIQETFGPTADLILLQHSAGSQGSPNVALPHKHGIFLFFINWFFREVLGS